MLPADVSPSSVQVTTVRTLYRPRSDLPVPSVPVRSSVDPGKRTLEVLAAVALPPAVVAAIIGLALGEVIGLVVAFVVVAAGLIGAVWVRSAGAAVDLGGDPPDPVQHARLLNLVDGLCVTGGVRMPALRVVEASGCNLAVVGRDSAHATLVVTSGLLEDLTRMELEGALATGVVELRRGDAGPATVAAAASGLTVGPALIVRLAVDPQRDRVMDEAAASLTRYPPGLTAAYEKFARHGTEVPGTRRRHAHLWLADPGGSSTPAPYRSSLQERIHVLAEL
jgi:heat shock protein HtpX